MVSLLFIRLIKAKSCKVLVDTILWSRVVVLARRFTFGKKGLFGGLKGYSTKSYTSKSLYKIFSNP